MIKTYEESYPRIKGSIIIAKEALIRDSNKKLATD